MYNYKVSVFTENTPSQSQAFHAEKSNRPKLGFVIVCAGMTMFLVIYQGKSSSRPPMRREESPDTWPYIARKFQKTNVKYQIISKFE